MIFKVDNWKEYNKYTDIANLQINDSIKLTTPKSESFWVEVLMINNNKIVGKIVNDLIKEYPYKLNDYIGFEIKHIKEVNKAINKFKPSDDQIRYIKEIIHSFKEKYKRLPTEEELQISLLECLYTT